MPVMSVRAELSACAAPPPPLPEHPEAHRTTSPASVPERAEFLTAAVVEPVPPLIVVDCAKVSPAQMSSVAERLRQRGLLAMERSPLDRRRQVWRSTPAGRGLLAALQLQLLALAQQFEAFVPPADQQAAIALCEQLADKGGCRGGKGQRGARTGRAHQDQFRAICLVLCRF